MKTKSQIPAAAKARPPAQHPHTQTILQAVADLVAHVNETEVFSAKERVRIALELETARDLINDFQPVHGQDYALISVDYLNIALTCID